MIPPTKKQHRLFDMAHFNINTALCSALPKAWHNLQDFGQRAVYPMERHWPWSKLTPPLLPSDMRRWEGHGLADAKGRGDFLDYRAVMANAVWWITVEPDIKTHPFCSLHSHPHTHTHTPPLSCTHTHRVVVPQPRILLCKWECQ